jgi:hypothetical protein
MNARRKKLIALVVLGGLWAGLILWECLSWEQPVRVPLANVSGSGGAIRQAHRGTDGLHVNLDLLAAARTQREMVFATPRNIFALPSVSVANQPAQSIAAELSQFHYVGFVRTGEQWEKKQDMAVLTKKDDLHIVRKGETVEAHVVVKKITQESVTLLDKDSRLEYTVLLSEEPQTPSP